MTRAVAIVLTALLLAPAASGAGDTQPVSGAGDSRLAVDYLSKALGDPERLPLALAALRATQDKDLLPVFVALSRSGDKRRRLFATTTLGELGGDKAIAALKERLKGDPMMAVRSEALVGLLGLKAISADELVAIVNLDGDGGDENVRCIAARALVRMDRGKDAARALGALTRSPDASTACMARLCLMKIGRAGHIEPLAKVLADLATPPEVVALLMTQIAEDKNTAAAPLVERVIRTGPRAAIPYAYKALSAVSPDAAGRLAKAIGKSDRTVLRIRLLGLLAGLPKAKPHLERIARGKDAVALLARFELARPSGGAKADAAFRAAGKIGHPVVLDYLLAQADKDIRLARARAAFYAAGLTEMVRSAPTGGQEMGPQHRRAAIAATLLADLGTPEAMTGLKRILAGRYNAVVRVTAAGLMRSKNRKVCELLRPLLKSPYEELACDAALTLGRFGDAAAGEYLSGIMRRPGRQPSPTAVLAAWYLLKIARRTRPAAGELARQIK